MGRSCSQVRDVAIAVNMTVVAWCIIQLCLSVCLSVCLTVYRSGGSAAVCECRKPGVLDEAQASHDPSRPTISGRTH